MMGGLSADRLGRIGPLPRRAVEDGTEAGAVALLARGGAEHVAAVGAMDRGSGRPMRRDTIFRILSMTKPVPAAAATILVEEGRFALDDPVDPRLPELADRRVLRRPASDLADTVPARRTITVRDLLTLRLGLGMMRGPDHAALARDAFTLAHAAID